MKKKYKILVVIIGIVLSVLIIIFLVNKNSNNINNENTINNLLASKEVSNIVFTNIKYKYEDDLTIISMKMFNKNDKTVKLGEFIVNVYDKDNNLLGTLNPNLSDTIEKNKSNEIEFSKKEKYDNAYSLEIELPNLELLDSE